MQKKTYLVLCVALTVILVGFLLLHIPQKTDNPASQAADTHETTDNQREKENNPNPSKKAAQRKMNLQAIPTKKASNAAVETSPLTRWFQTKKAYVWLGEIVVGAILLDFFPQYKIILLGLWVLLLLL